MSGPPIDELIIKMSADVGGLTASMTRMGDLVGQLSQQIGDKVEKGTTRGFVKALVVVEAFKKAITFTKDATYDLVKAQLEEVDQLAKMSDKLGVTTEAMVAMTYAAEMNGVEQEQLSASIVKMQRSLQEATDKTSRASSALRILGVDLKDLQALSPDQQLATLAQKIAAIEDPSERTAVAIELLGKNGVQIAQSFRDGTASLEEARAATERLGLSINRVDAAKIEAANDAMERVGMAIDGVARQLAIESAPFLEAIADYATEAMTDTTNLKDNIKSVFEVIVKGVAYAADAVKGFQIMWYGVKVGITAIGAAVYTVAQGIDRALTEAARYGVIIMTKMINGIVQGFSWMLEKMADLVSIVDEDWADSMRAGAASMSKAADDTATAVIKSIDQIADKRNADNAATAQNARDLFTDAKRDLDAAINSPIPHEAIIEWGEAIVAKAAEVGKRAAAAVAAGQEQAKAEDGGASPKSIEKDQELQELREKLMTETEIEIDEYQKRKDLLDELKAAGQISDEEFNMMSEQIEEKHQLALFQIKQRGLNAEDTLEKARRASAVRGTRQMFSDLSTLMNTHSRKAFEIGKAAAIAGATIDGIKAAVSAWAAGMSVGGPYAPVVAAAYTAASLAATGAQIASIQSQSFGGGGGSNGGGGIGAAPVLPQGDAPGANGNGGGGGRQVSVTLIGKSYDREQIEDLVAAINDAGDDGVKIRR